MMSKSTGAGGDRKFIAPILLPGYRRFMHSRGGRKFLGSGLGVCILWALISTTAPAQTFTSGITSGHIANSAIIEASGIAASQSNPNVLWTEEDSGNPAWLYAMTSTGASLSSPSRLSA